MGKTGLIKNVFYYIQKKINLPPVFIWIYFQPRIFRSLYLYWDEVCWEIRYLITEYLKIAILIL